jgi:hypothetical protein
MLAQSLVEIRLGQFSSGIFRTRQLLASRFHRRRVNEKKTVHFSLGSDELTYWSTGRKDRVEEPATFDVWVGGDSTASLHANFNITD